MISSNILSLGSLFSQRRILDTLWGELHYTLTSQSRSLKSNKPIWKETPCSGHLSITDTILGSDSVRYTKAALQVFLGEGVLKIYSKLAGEHPWHGCSPVNLLHIFRTPFCQNTSGGLLLAIESQIFGFREKSREKEDDFLLPLFAINSNLNTYYYFQIP